MTNQFQNFMAVIEALNRYQVDYVLVGGVAVILHGLERLTRDIDIFIKPDRENVDKLRRALHSIFDDQSIDEITTEELQKYAVIRYGTPEGFYIDIMTKLGELFSFQDLEYEIIEYKGIKIRLATPGILYKMKKDTVRFQDKIDALFLQEIIGKQKSKR